MAGLVPAIHVFSCGAAAKTWMPGTGPGMTREISPSSEGIERMPSDTPLAFHRRRISQLSNTIGAWFRCPNASCRRAGACRRADDVFPPCIVPVMRGVNESLMTYLNALPGMPPRKPAESESAHAQIERLNKRLGNLLEAEIERIEKRRGIVPPARIGPV
jgi:hypothetical protein